MCLLYKAQSLDLMHRLCKSKDLELICLLSFEANYLELVYLQQQAKELELMILSHNGRYLGLISS